jgi:hypothetical protein
MSLSRIGTLALLVFASMATVTCAHHGQLQEAHGPPASLARIPAGSGHGSGIAANPGVSAAIPGATVTMGTNTKLSASVYDSSGQVVRHLYEIAPRAGTVTLSWDGKDDMGYDAPSGAYVWRALTTNATGSDDGSVGDLGKVVASHPYSQSENPALVSALTYDASGNLYVVSAYEEQGGTLRRIDRGNLGTGLTTWGKNIGGGQAIATDGTYVYVAQHATLLRFDATTGATASWSGHPGGIPVYPWTTGEMPIPGLAVDPTYLWVTDPVNHKLWVFHKADGTPAKIIGRTNWFAFARPASPRGIATDGANHFWIAMSGSGGSAQRYTYDPIAQSMALSAKTDALANPFGVAWYKSGSTSALYVTEIGTGHVLKYDLSGARPVQEAQWLSAMPGAGAVTDTALAWQFGGLSWIPGGDAAIAVDQFDGGKFGVVDTWNERTMFYNTADGTVAATPRLMGFNFPAPDVDLKVGEDWLASGWEQYQVTYNRKDEDYGHPWVLKYNWHPTDDPAGHYFPHTNSAAVYRKLSDGNEYLYSFVGGSAALPIGGIVIYRLNTDGVGSGMKRCAQIKSASTTGEGPIEVRTDTNGNGILDDGHGNPDPGDTVSRRIGNFSYPYLWVDPSGTVWMQNLTLGAKSIYGVGKLPISGFDGRSNPVYDVSSSGPLQRVTTFQIDSVTGAAEFTPSHLRYDAVNNRLFLEVITPYRNTNPGGFNYAGGGVYMVDLTTGQSSKFAIPTQALPLLRGPNGKPQVPMRAVVGGIAVDTEGNYFYTGDSIHSGGPGQEVRMFTWDGLPVAAATPATPTNNAGWLDIGFSLTAFTHSNGTHYVYAEDNGYGRNIRYAFSNVGTTLRSGGNFTWTGPSAADGLVGWWRLDEENGQYVVDSSGGNHFGLVGPSGDTTTWNPIGGWNPTGGRLHGAFSFNGKNPNGTAILLSKSVVVPLADNLIENARYSTLTFACWVKTGGSGVVMSYQGSPWGPSPTTYVPAMYIGLDGKARAKVNGASRPMVSPSVVNDDSWHHLTLVVGSSSQTFYVDGAPVDTVSGGLVPEGMAYTLMGVGFTNSVEWPETPPVTGWYYYRGLIDDARLYNHALSAAEVAALALPPAPSGPLAWWKFDETAGKIAADSSDHGNDATVTGGAWVPTGGHLGGAFSFDGKSTIVTLPDSLVENPAYTTLTFACWIKTSGAGVIIEYENGPYPTSSPTPLNNSVFPMLYIGQDGYLYGSVWTNGSTGRLLKSVQHVNTNSWHHLALAAGSTTICLYVDGNLVDHIDAGAPWGVLYQSGFLNEQLGTGYSLPPNDPPSWSSRGSFFYSGLLDDARFYGRDLSATEIRQLASVVGKP